jgi:membrane protease YdiL (CAAX protease family)
MLASSSSLPVLQVRRTWLKAIGLSVWVFAGFFAAQSIVIVAILGLRQAGVVFTSFNQVVISFILAATVYMLTIGIVIGLPKLIKHLRTTMDDIGLTRLPDWRDILMAPAGFVVYLLASSVLVYTAQQLFPHFDVTQAQDTGFSHLSNRYEYLLAFITLVVIAPVAEEILMRGYLYGKLRRLVPFIAAALLTSIVFGVLHGQLNVGVDVFALSLVLCSLREVTGSIWAGILLHMMKNGLAFYLLFINPSFLHTIGG